MPDSEATGRTTAEAVRDAVRRDFEDYTYVTPLSDFLDHFFPNDEKKFKGIFDELKAAELYKDGKWQGLPLEPGGTEAEYYKPFFKLLNGIVDNVKGEKPISACWLNTSTKTPESATTGAAGIMPDGLYYTGNKNEVDELKKEILKEYEEYLKTISEGVSPGQSTGEKRNHTAADKQENNSQDARPFRLSQKLHARFKAAWIRTLAVIEIKTFVPEAPDDATVIQAGSYKRYVLRDQQDRMFVFSVILYHRFLSLWYSDRSGLLGGEAMIDIDESPLDFIRVFAGLAMMTPEQLGFNPYMKRVVDGQEIYSYDPQLTRDEAKKLVYDINWRFTVPLKDEHRLYQSVRSISIARSEVMCGRATLVWNALDLQKKEKRVLKACWRPIEEKEKGNADVKRELPNASVAMKAAAGREIDAYKRMDGGGVYLGKLVEAFDLPGTQTLTSFRKGLHCQSLKAYRKAVKEQNAKRKAKDAKTVDQNPEEDTREQSLHIKNATTNLPSEVEDEQPPLVNRGLCWMLFESIGWPVRYFLTLQELLTTIRDALKGYERLYNRGIVHRDISVGNIIIELTDSNKDPSPTKTSGTLIDLDHAKILAEDYVPIKVFDYLDEQASARHEDVEELYGSLSYKKIPHRPSPRLAVFLVETFLDDAEARFKRLVKGLDSSKELDFKDIGLKFDENTCIPPDFSNRQAEQTFRSGTLPFMSGQLFTQDPTPHSAVHDMESVFWVLLYLCLTRNGPGGNRREELNRHVDNNSSDDEKGVHRLAYCFFDGQKPDVIRNKQKLLDYRKMDLLQPFVLQYFHPYFDSLKPLIAKLKNILTNAYKEMAVQVEGQPVTGIYWQYPVAAFLHAIEEELADISGKEPQSPAYSLLRQQEEERRQRDIDLFSTELIPNDIPNELLRPSTPTNNLGSLSHLAHDPGSPPSNLSTRHTNFDSPNTTPTKKKPKHNK